MEAPLSSSNAGGNADTQDIPHIQHVPAGAGHDEHSLDYKHHEEGNFFTKYVFSTDHKVIAKQFLITGIAWAFLGGALSSIFRLQLGCPEATFVLI